MPLAAAPTKAFEHVVENVFWSTPAGALKRRTVAALYRLPMVNYDTLDKESQRSEMGTTVQLLNQLKTDVTIYRLNRFYPIGQYTEQARELVVKKHAHRDRWEHLLGLQVDVLEGLSPWEPQLFLMVVLKEDDDSTIAAAVKDGRRAGAAWLESFREFFSRVEHTMGLGTGMPIDNAEIDRQRELEKDMFRRIRNLVGSETTRASSREIYWWLSRHDRFPIEEPTSDENFDLFDPDAMSMETGDGRRMWYPQDQLITNLAGSPVDRRAPKYVVVEGPEGRVYSTTLIMGDLPKTIDWPQQEAELLSLPVDDVGFPVDVMLPLRYQSNEEARKLAARGKYDAERAFADQEKGVAGGASWDADDKRQLSALQAHNLGQPSSPGMLWGRARLRVACGIPYDLTNEVDGPRTLRESVRALNARYGGLKLHQPAGIQLQLHYDWLPRTHTEIQQFDRWLSPDQVGAMMPQATQVCGDDRGPIVGHTMAGNRPVKYEIGAASRTNLPPTILLAGVLGAGKTQTLSMFEHQAVLQGALVADLDPKPDHLFHQSDISDLVSRIELDETSQEFAGLLDPMRCAPSSERLTMTVEFLSQLLAASPRDERAGISLLQICTARCIQEERFSSRAVIEELRVEARRLGSSDQARSSKALEFAESLDAASHTIAQTAFAPADNQEIGWSATRPLTTIVMRALKGASGALGDERTTQDYITNALMTCMSGLLTSLVSGEKERWKVVAWDEAWALLKTAHGRQQIDRMVRLGRSENLTPILATQNLADVPKDTTNLLGQIIIHRISAAEAPTALTLLGLDPRDRDMADRISNPKRFTPGRCLWKDLQGRVSEVQLTPTDYLLDQYGTTVGGQPSPDDHQVLQEIRPAA